MKYQLYPWQDACLKRWQRNQQHGIVNVITGAGKTYLALAACKLLEEQVTRARLRVTIVVPSASLLTQWALALREFFGDQVSRRDIGLYYGGRRDTPDRPFMIYVINSARYSLARHVVSNLEQGFTVFLIADECHRYIGGENQKIFEFLPFTRTCPQQYASLGLSATPGLGRPENASVLIPALGPEIFRYGFKEAREDETLCPYVAFHTQLSFTDPEKMAYEDLSNRMRKTYCSLISHFPGLKGLDHSAFFRRLFQLANEKGSGAGLARLYLNCSHKRKHLTSDAYSRTRCVLKLIDLLDQSARLIIFGERIEQADILYRLLDKLYPNQAARFHSAMAPAARKLALERFKDGQVRILISCRALDEGFDVPSADVGIVMSSASVNRQRIQRLGRILRRFEGKEIASLYYLYIAESSEEATYFPVEDQTSAVCELSYHWENDTFSHPLYEKKARSALRSFKRRKPAPGLLEEAENCFSRGMIRPDWKLGREYCLRKIETADTVEERNYWICMKQLNA